VTRFLRNTPKKNYSNTIEHNHLIRSHRCKGSAEHHLFIWFDFDLVQVKPSDVAQFLDQWEGRRSAQAYKAHLSKFFAWCCRRGLLNSNPARDVTVEKPQARDVYMTDEQYLAIHKYLAIGKDKRPTRSGPMIQCYMDLLYLFISARNRGAPTALGSGERRWNQIQANQN
jgi:hypothetical protein